MNEERVDEIESYSVSELVSVELSYLSLLGRPIVLCLFILLFIHLGLCIFQPSEEMSAASACKQCLFFSLFGLIFMVATWFIFPNSVDGFICNFTGGFAYAVISIYVVAISAVGVMKICGVLPNPPA